MDKPQSLLMIYACLSGVFTAILTIPWLAGLVEKAGRRKSKAELRRIWERIDADHALYLSESIRMARDDRMMSLEYVGKAKAAKEAADRIAKWIDRDCH